tara:strand:+ start:547 stop:951 length:405 start_codon:yes stop_codon:yes gene_type:complete
MTFVGMQERYSEWDDYSQEAFDKAFDKAILMAKKQLVQLDALNADALDQATTLSLTLYRKHLENSIDDEQWLYHNYPINQMQSIHSNIPSLLINQHLVTNIEEAKAYIALVQAVPVIIKDLNIRANRGGNPPDK